MTRTLVLGTDFSEGSDRAVRRAVFLSRHSGYHLHILHVLEQEENDHERAAELLRRIQLNTSELDDVSCDTDVCEGSAAEQVCSVADIKEAELIVIGPHRHSAVADPFRRTTAERIIRKTSIPLLVATAVPAGQYRQVLLSVDLNDGFRSAIARALSLPFIDGGVVLFHAFDAEASEMLGRTLATGSERESYVSQEASRAEAELAKFADNVGCSGSQLLLRQSTGGAGRDILSAARDTGADLIIMAAHKHGLVYETVVGSAVRSVLKTGEHDVLIV